MILFSLKNTFINKGTQRISSLGTQWKKIEYRIEYNV